MLTPPPIPLQVYICEQHGLQQVADYWHSVVKINDFQKQRFVGRMIDAMFNTISGKKIAVLGFAFKKDTGDTRETPAIDVCRGLLEDNAQVIIYDPQVSLHITLLGMHCTPAVDLPLLQICWVLLLGHLRTPNCEAR